MNKVDGKPLPKVSAEAIALHKTLTIVDLHSDTLMWKRDVLDRATHDLLTHRLHHGGREFEFSGIVGWQLGGGHGLIG